MIRHVLLTLGLILSQSVFADNKPIDSDKDGIADNLDLCSNTPAGTKVWMTGEWTGCAQGQSRDRDVILRNRAHSYAQAIIDCEVRTDSRVSNVKVYVGSTCAPYAYQYNSVTQVYTDLCHAQGGSYQFLVSQSDAYLVDRYNRCIQNDIAAANVLNTMYRSGCSSYPHNLYEPDYGSSGGSGSSAGGTSPSSGGTGPISTPNGGFFGGFSGTYTTSGNVTIGPNGTSYVTNGNVTVGSNGTSYITNGNVTIGSDGTSYTQSGNVIVGSNGRVCVVSGSVTTCS